MFSATNICAEDEGLARSARSVGTSVLAKKLEDPRADKLKGIYALVVMIMLKDATEVYGFYLGRRDKQYIESTVASTAGILSS